MTPTHLDVVTTRGAQQVVGQNLDMVADERVCD
jgi:hypothetical protein